MTVSDIRQIAAMLRDRTPLQRLAPIKPWNTELSGRIAAAVPGSSPDELALKSGLLLWNDDLDASHTISQDVETGTGSFWHGIMHRMEGDYGNAKYWFHRVGQHPVFPELAAKASLKAAGFREQYPGSREAALLSQLVRDGEWKPYAFVDCVEWGAGEAKDGLTHSPYVEALERIQRDEVELLLSFCFRQVFGGTLFEPNER
ncbi:hypothetical protein [Paenibacillus alkalitolerans]|uniref:hypothetical protein n=1 Tax=Paenibacillus alkalitolerans TaxID=2799335 RepID=UPI0018F44F3B|nr:hypothetical protein [Paenibacillus alkalitolerans]